MIDIKDVKKNNSLTEHERNLLKGKEIPMDWSPISFDVKFNNAITNLMHQAVCDLHEYVKKNLMDMDDAIVLNPCIENSFNYQILVAEVGEIHAKQYVNAVIKEMKEEFEEYYDTFNQKFFKGLMREL